MCSRPAEAASTGRPSAVGGGILGYQPGVESDGARARDFEVRDDRVWTASPSPARTIGTRSNPQVVITPLVGWWWREERLRGRRLVVRPVRVSQHRVREGELTGVEGLVCTGPQSP
jgi:hypothetical protein